MDSKKSHTNNMLDAWLGSPLRLAVWRLRHSPSPSATPKRRAINVGALACLGAITAAVAIPARADDAQDRRPRASSTVQDAGRVQKDLMERTKEMGPWEEYEQVSREATDNVFQQNNWTSESDQWALDIVHDVNRIAPWNFRERQDVFMNHLQTRYDLTEHQKQDLSGDIQREAMRVAMKHFRETAPIAMEMIGARARGEPFTPEMVQRWSQKLDPVMADARASLERVAKRLGETMSPSQRERLERDLKATLRRHDDVVKMVAQWKQGKWTPTDWGLQNDPMHAGQMAEINRRNAERDARVFIKVAEGPLAGAATATDESSWERYVRLFCVKYQCDKRQTDVAHAILKSSEKEARNIRAARKSELEKITTLIRSADTKDRHGELTTRRDRLLAPIGAVFERMCRKLEAQVITREQRERVRRTVRADKTKAEN